jgi:hypothetical protein
MEGRIFEGIRKLKTFIRGIEGFIFVLISAFFTQIAFEGDAIDITQPQSQSRIIGAFLAAAGIAFRQWSATRNT